MYCIAVFDYVLSVPVYGQQDTSTIEKNIGTFYDAIYKYLLLTLVYTPHG
jgi:hypothetical protein